MQELTRALQALHNIEVWGGFKAQRNAGALHPWQSRDGRLQRLLPIGTWRLPIAAWRRPVAAQRLPGRRDSWRRHTVGVERGCSRHAWLLEALWAIATLAHMTSLNSIASSLRAGGENVTCGREAEASLSVHEFDQHWAPDFNQEPIFVRAGLLLVALHYCHSNGTASLSYLWRAARARLGTRDVHPSTWQALATYDLPELSCCQLHAAPLLGLILNMHIMSHPGLSMPWSLCVLSQHHAIGLQTDCLVTVLAPDWLRLLDSHVYALWP